MERPPLPSLGDYSDDSSRSERLASAERSFQFRSIRDRTATDQADVIAAGYDSVEQFVIDELGRGLHMAFDDIAWLKQGHNEVVDAVGNHQKSLEAIDHDHAQRVVDTVREETAKASEAGAAAAREVAESERDVHVARVEALEGRIEALEARLAAIQPAEGVAP